MKGPERRKHIVDDLSSCSEVLSGTQLAAALNVSRQVIVQDVALLRADGYRIVATNKGYLLQKNSACAMPFRTLKVRHKLDEIESELTTIVDLGGMVRTVMVNHRFYGKIVVELNIENRRDVFDFLESIRLGKSSPLMTVTCGYHYHEIAAHTEAVLDEIEAALAQKGFLVIKK